MLHQLHLTYLPLTEGRPDHPQALQTRARRWKGRRRRLRELLRAPASRLPLGLGAHHA
jgi:hypothetical protein